MFNGNCCPSLADIAAVTGGGSNSRSGSDGWGDGWWIILLFIFIAAFGGWGGNGAFGGGSGAQGAIPYIVGSGAATRADITDGFATNDIQSGIRAIQSGICDSTYALNNAITSGFSSNQLQLCNGFNGVQAQMANLAAQQQSCCCETQRAIENGFATTNYNLASQACETKNAIQSSTRDILENNNANTRAILDFLTQSKIDSLQTELVQAQGQLSQAQQTNNIIAALRTPSPVPAYTVPSPYASAFGGCGNTCGYGCGCAC